jgi:hypothetical protein
LEDASKALGDELVAPPLLWSEVPSVLHAMAFRREISQALAEQGLERFVAGKLAITAKLRDGADRLGFVVTPAEL